MTYGNGSGQGQGPWQPPGRGPWQAPGQGQGHGQPSGPGQQQNHGPWHAPGQGGAHGQPPGQGPGQEPGRTPGYEQWQQPGEQNKKSNAVWWVLGSLGVLGLIAVVVAGIGVTRMLNNLDVSEESQNSAVAASSSSSSSSSTPPTRPSSPTPTTEPDSSGAGGDPIRKPPRFPQVKPAADLPEDQAAALGVDVDIQTSELRYVVLDMFGEPIYNCIFSADFQNLTDQPIEVTAEFQTTGDTRLEWSSGSPNDFAPNDSTELVLGWDGLSREEVGLSEDECTGPVELTFLEVASG
ncbi:MAG TPA: hypothetical protein H9878_08180 [Candidatus Dietzia merdigallinarum]|nr:hypothetical protein [Candidatus Dietzia merdigallinarum]